MDQLFAAAQESGSSGSGFSTIWYIIGAVGLWKMFEKAGVEGWAGLIPFYREYKLCEKVMGDPWYWLRELWVIVPVIGWIMALYYKYQISKATAKAYGKPEGWAWGYLFLDPIFYCITGFDDSSYYGVFGGGDTRTGEAREAKTVDFDVTKNTAPVEPVSPVAPVEPVEPVVEEVKAEPVDEVEFDFNQGDSIEE